MGVKKVFYGFSRPQGFIGCLPGMPFLAIGCYHLFMFSFLFQFFFKDLSGIHIPSKTKEITSLTSKSCSVVASLI